MIICNQKIYDDFVIRFFKEHRDAFEKIKKLNVLLRIPFHKQPYGTYSEIVNFAYTPIFTAKNYISKMHLYDASYYFNGLSDAEKIKRYKTPEAVVKESEEVCERYEREYKKFSAWLLTSIHECSAFNGITLMDTEIIVVSDEVLNSNSESGVKI